MRTTLTVLGSVLREQKLGHTARTDIPRQLARRKLFTFLHASEVLAYRRPLKLPHSEGQHEARKFIALSSSLAAVPHQFISCTDQADQLVEVAGICLYSCTLGLEGF